MRTQSAIILGAGKGTRMKSNRPKVLCELMFRPMIHHVADACKGAGVQDLCIITGYQAEEVETSMRTIGDFTFARQNEQRGTGHAVMMATDFLLNHLDGDVLVLCGDAPCIDSDTIAKSHAQHVAEKNAITVITAKLPDAGNYGRILRKHGRIRAIVERADCNDNQIEIKEINAGAYWFDAKNLLDCLSRLTTDNAQGEYYLTDTIALTLSAGNVVGGYLAPDPSIILGANSRFDLLELNEYIRQNTIRRHMENGVNFIATDGVIIAPDAVIGVDTDIYPGSIIKNNVQIGEGCTIGPNTVIADSVIGDHVKLNQVQCYQSKVDDFADIGPFVHIRPNSTICHHVHIGDFVEVKNSTIGAGTGISHLTYVGDSDVGKNVNFGCGVVTVNYDGVRKNRCTIGDGAFIGCNTNLVAPVTIGDNGYTAAGSTITADVPENALGIARARQELKADFSVKKLAGRKYKVKP